MRPSALALTLVVPILAGCDAPPALQSVPDLELVSLGEDRGFGNVLALELYADPAAYATEERRRTTTTVVSV